MLDILTELRRALISYQDYHMLLPTLADGPAGGRYSFSCVVTNKGDRDADAVVLSFITPARPAL